MLGAYTNLWRCIYKSAWLIYKLGRVIEQLWKDQGAKINEFMTAFEKLRQDLNSGTLQHTAFVTSRISEDVIKLGA